ncbi:MAG: DNA polymerase III subunit alpha, partial [Saprospirales bacterium]
RYGEEHTALLATYNTFGLRSVIRELGKVFGLPTADIDLIAEQPEAIEKHHDYGRHILHYARIMDGMPNYLSIHAGGVLISERSLYYHTGLKLMPKGFPITHFDMHDAEDMGFHKYDILSQRGLGHIKDAVDVIFENKKIRLDVRDVARIKEDRRVKEQLKSGHCIGCFYIESPAMRGLLQKLRCDNYVHLVAASSIIRPGVAQSGMMREYIKRFHHPDEVEYLHPVFEEHLSETFGVMVYQEDVMKVVHHFAGLDLDESDILRRIMTGKKKSGDTFKRLEEKYFRNCRERGYSDELSREVWRMVESFSGYSFCKAHSASFAVESFQSLYLKAYYPLEFMVAVINNFGGFYSTEFYVHEARMCGARIEAPCVNNSNLMTTIKGDTIYLGFIHMKNLERKAAINVCRERKNRGPYAGIDDFMARTGIDSEQLQLLIRIGAFRFTGRGKFELMWEKCRLRSLTISAHDQNILFDCPEVEPLELELPKESRLEQSYDEIELLGFPLCSPFELLQEQPVENYCAADLPSLGGKKISICGYLVCVKPVRTIHRQRMAFVTWLDKDGHFFDSVHFPQQWQQFPLRGRACYRIEGKVTADFGLFSVEASRIQKLAYRSDPRFGG